MGRPLRRLLAERRVERIDERFGVVAIAGSFRVFIAVLPLERSLPPSYAPRALAFKLSLAAHQNRSSHTHNRRLILDNELARVNIRCCQSCRPQRHLSGTLPGKEAAVMT